MAADREGRVSRRRWLATVATGSLAGCPSLGGDGAETPRSTTTPTATDTDVVTASHTEAPVSAPLDPGDYGPPPADADWEPTLVDFFDEGRLDESVWSLGVEGHHDGPHCADQGHRSFCWTREHVTVDSETNRLRLRITDEAVPPADREPADAEANYAAGAVNTRGRFSQEFGYFEAAARIPDEPGTLPAFFLFLDKFEHDWREIDVYEKNGSQDPTTLLMGAYVERDDGSPAPPSEEFNDNDDRVHLTAGADTPRVNVGTPVDERFHVVGVEWAPDALTWYVDGDPVGRVDDPAVAEYFPGEELFLVANGAVFEGADWLGSPTDATFPHYHEFEWVRAWQYEDWK